MNEKLTNFSLLMSVYQKDDPFLFNRAIKSVFDNTLQPDEFILVVDGSITEQLESVIDIYKNNPIFKICRLTENQGLASALNFGLNQITTEFVLRADADDINMPKRFEIQSQYMIDGFDLFGSDIMEVDKRGAEFGVRTTPKNLDAILKFSKNRSPFNHMTVGYRVRVVRECGGYPNLDLREDYALWVLMLAKGISAANSGEILVKATTGLDMYRRRGGFRSVRAEFNMQKFLVMRRFKSITQASIDFLLKAIIFLMPAYLRGVIYRHLLRD